MKNFTNNFKQFTSRLSARWLIMALMLLVGTSSAWAATVNGVIYFEKPNANWGTPVLCLGKSDGSQMNFTMELHCGNIYKKQVTWGEGNATCIAFTDCTGNWGWEGNSLEHRLNYISGNGTYKYDISSNPAGKIFKPGTTNNSVNNGNGKLYVWDGGFVQAFSESLCCTAPASAPSLSKVSDIVKCGTTTTTSGTLKITTVNAGSTYYYKKGTNGSDVQINFGNNNQFTVSSTGDYYVKEVNDCGASSSWSSKVTISETNNSVSISDISGPANLCSGSSADYLITAIDGVSYNWSIDSNKFTLGSNESNSVSVTANGTTATSATLTIEATKSGCPTPKTKTINIVPLPTISTVSPKEGTVCTGTTISDLEQTLTITKSANSTTKWYKGEDEKSSTATVETGEYTIKAISYTGSCVSNSSVTYTVTGITTIPTDLVIDINESTSATICGGTATINAKASGATSYTLYKGDTDKLVETKNGDANGVTFTVSEENTYKVKATNNCESTDFSSTVELIVKNVPSKPSFTTSSEVTCSGVTVSPTLSPALAQGNYLVWYDAATGGNKIGTDGKTLTSGANNTATTYYAAVSNGSCESATRTPYTVYVESTDITNLRLYLVDDQGNELPDNHVYCQGETVKFKLSYNGGKYTAYSWNQTVQANSNISGSTSLNKENNTGAGSFTLAGVQSSGTITITLTSCSGEPSITSNALQVTVAPVPTISIKIRDLNVPTLEVMCHELVTLYATTENTVDGALVYWYKDGVQITENGQPVTGDSYTFTSTTATTFSNISAKVQNGTSCPAVESNKVSVTFEAHAECPPSYKQGKIVYLQPNDKWKEANARFAAYFFSGGTEIWVNMTDEDGDGVYACEVPEDRSKVIFCRMNPSGGNDFNNKWAQSGDLVLSDLVNKKFVINDSNAGGGSGSAADLESGKTFKTIVLNTNGVWNIDGAIFKAHPWVDGGSEGNWPRMIKGINNGVYLVDVYTTYNRILFERCNPSDQSRWNVTADLVLDIYGNEFKILTSEGHGEWQWRWFQSTYDLGVQTNVVEQNGENLEIHCTGVVYKTSCAPSIKYGFEYATKQNMTSATYVEYAQGAIDPGASFEKYIAVEPGEYYVRARAQYENNAAVYGCVKKVIIANNCDPEYEFTVGSTSAIVQACGGNRTLPAIEILTDKTPAGKTISWTYEWKNADGTTATNLDYATGNATPTFNGIATQSYKVRVIKKEGSDIKCVQTAEYQVAYEDNSPKATIVAREEVAINETLVLQGSINYSESFTWLVKEGNTDVTAQKLSDVSVLNPTFDTQETGTYTVTLTAEANENCEAHQTSITIEVLPPTENCSSTDLEIQYDFTNSDEQSRTPKFFNGYNDVYYTYKLKGEECKYTSLENSNKLSRDQDTGDSNDPSFFSIIGLTEANFPITLYIIAQSEYGGKRGYAEFEITSDYLGKRFVCNATGGENDYTTTDAICAGNAKAKAKTTSTKEVTISNTVSAPSVLSPAAVVNGQSTEVELKAYLETTGCSPISDYGFEYIKQDEQPTSATGATKVSLKATPITIGKTFRTQVSGLTEGVYWFRAYANNEAGKSGSTSWISFTIITDGPYPTLNCNNNALQILDNGKVKVTVTNIGNEPVLKGSYGLTIIDQGAVLAYSPQQVPAIDANNGTVEFTTVLPINKNNYNVTATLTYKGRTQSCNTKICVPQVGGTPDTIRYTIDAAAVTDKCMLVFPTVYEAIDHLKSSKDGDDRFVDKVGDGYMLRQPVVMEVVYSTTPYRGNVRLTTTGGYEGGEGHLVINITNINNDGNSGNGKYKIDESGNIVDGYNPLIIRAANPNAMPALQHVALRKSRSVTLRNLNIISSDVDKDNAIDIDNNNNSWVGNGIGAFKNAKITISNCKIKSKGFTCVHVSAVDKVYFENNEITADLENKDVQDENTRCWGSSVKFIRSTNIKFIRNNFTGTHATSVWLQGVEKVLFMNNVFWNNNKIEEDIFAMFRIVQQSDPEKPKNIGIYYNTLFLADNSDGRSKHPKFNFLTLNSNDKSSKDDPIAHDGNFETSTIEFKYNNCYSYDLETPGKPSYSFKNRDPWSGLCYNNFWSAKSGADFSFNGCSTIYNVNVKDIVCTTTATDPNSLVISQPGLNKGNKPTVDAETGNVGTSGIALNSDAELYYDRTRDEARVGVAEGQWTLGAYQQTANVETEAIIWQGGASDEWDDRNNWIDARTKKTLTCVNTLSKDLQVIIPAPHSENYPAPDERGIVNYPILPEFDVRDSKFGGELVNAGQGVVEDENPITPTQFAKTINMEYGASLRGVEHLGAGSGSHYDETTTGFTAQRDQWILVGTVVKPWTDKSKQSTRNIKSGDYFITGQTPHVYMHYAYMEGNTAKWSEPFTSLEESLEVTDVMAINIPNQYGAGKLTSQAYYTYVKKDPTKINDHLEAKDYSFNGRFVNESALPSYTGLQAGVPVLLNNSYPANIDPKVIEAKNLGTVLMYDYKAGSFCIDPQADKEAVIKPQHGFIFTPAGNALTITSDMVVNGETTSRSAGVEMPILSLDLYNANSINGERSRVVIKLDELKDEGPAPLDVTKIFTDNSTTPELYIVMYDNQYQRIHISNTETIIPLGIRLKKSMNVSFQKFSAEGFDKVTLVDKVLNTEYDLLNTKEVITEELSAGDIEGRFFLNLKETEEDDNIEGEDNVSTEIEEDSAEKCINILVEADNTVKVITNGVELENIYVSDMAGRTVGYKASGYSAVVELPVVQGVYMINVIGDTASRTEKVILK